jgi:hypothetical protein
MKGLSNVNRVFQLITGILFIAFGLLSLASPMLALGNGIVWVAGGLTLAALIRLVLICLPASTHFAGSASLAIAAGILESLFGLCFILDALIYVEFLYPLIAAILLALAVIRVRQSVLVKRRGFSGWGSYLFMAILLLAASAGLILFEYLVKLDLQVEVAGAAAFMYGFFLSFSAFFKAEAAGAAEISESVDEPVNEVAGEDAAVYPGEDLGNGSKIAE